LTLLERQKIDFPRPGTTCCTQGRRIRKTVEQSLVLVLASNLSTNEAVNYVVGQSDNSKYEEVPNYSLLLVRHCCIMWSDNISYLRTISEALGLSALDAGEQTTLMDLETWSDDKIYIDNDDDIFDACYRGMQSQGWQLSWLNGLYWISSLNRLCPSFSRSCNHIKKVFHKTQEYC
jgi:hypothetical protein